MGEIKSAFEKAMEKVANLEKPSTEEALEWKYVPEGQKLASEYLKEEGNLAAEVGKFKDEVKRYVVKGAEEVLLRSIGLPVNQAAKKNTKKAMEGIKALKKDKAALENAYSKMRRIFDHTSR